MSYRKYLMQSDISPSTAYEATAVDFDTDTISRQAAIDAINKALSRVFTEPCGEQILKDLPSAQPERINRRLSAD